MIEDRRRWSLGLGGRGSACEWPVGEEQKRKNTELEESKKNAMRVSGWWVWAFCSKEEQIKKKRERKKSGEEREKKKEKKEKKRERDLWDVIGFCGPQSPPIYEHATENQILSDFHDLIRFFFLSDENWILSDENSSKQSNLLWGPTKFGYWVMKIEYWVIKTLKPNNPLVFYFFP